MAAFTSMDQAEARAKAMTANNTWVEGHAARAMDGTIIVRFMRFMSVTATPLQHGAWVETNQDNVT